MEMLIFMALFCLHEHYTVMLQSQAYFQSQNIFIRPTEGKCTLLQQVKSQRYSLI